MSSMKKNIAVIFSLLFTTVVLSINATAGEFIDFTYSEIDGKIKIEGYKGFDKEVSIPSEIEMKPVTIIGEVAFSGNGPSVLQIPKSITNIMNGSLNSLNLVNIKVAEDNPHYTSVDGVLFSKDKKTLIKYPSNKKLNNYFIPESVINISGHAFHYCRFLTNINIPKSVANIGNYAFILCGKLKNIEVSEENTYFTSINGVLFTKDKKNLVKFPDKKSRIYKAPMDVAIINIGAFANCSELTSIILPDSITEIRDFAFYNCNGLRTITIPNNVQYLGKYSFYLCTGLTDIIIPNRVAIIEAEAFRYCSSLKNINIHNGVINIEAGAFAGCIKLTNIIIPDSINKIGAGAFSGCINLKDIVVSKNVLSIGNGAFGGCKTLVSINTDKNNLHYTSIDGVLLSKDIKTLIQYPAGKKSDIYIIPDSVTAIDAGAFCYNSYLVNIIVPRNTTSMMNSGTNECLWPTISGYKNSYAEKFAKENNIPFKPVD